MKALKIILLLLSFSGIIYSQPIISTDWFHTVGDTTVTGFFYPSSSMTPNEGLNIVWDISNSPDPSFIREKIWVEASELTHQNEFPSATLGFAASFGREFYFKVTDDNFQQVGLKSGSTKIEYDNNAPILAYRDFSFGDSKINNYSVSQIAVQNSDTTSYQVTDEFIYAGYGTVITPMGSYDNCIMTKLVRISSDSTSNLNEYYFHKDRLSNVIAQYSHSPINTEPPRKIEYILEQLSTNTNQVNKANIHLKGIRENTLVLDASSNVSSKVIIFEASGKQVLAQTRALSIGNNEIDIRGLGQSTIYFLLVIDTKTGAFQSFKFYK